jgi:hypothetical protein
VKKLTGDFGNGLGAVLMTSIAYFETFSTVSVKTGSVAQRSHVCFRQLRT